MNVALHVVSLKSVHSLYNCVHIILYNITEMFSKSIIQYCTARFVQCHGNTN